MVKVPSDLSGASLLGVHNWVKSNIARSNPGTSPDYKITDSKGNRMTLSDVARSVGKDVNIEVTTIDGTRSNPASNLTMIPDMQTQYPNLVRTGNNLTDLLPDEIDSAMATRIVAEQGLYRGLHTLNRMSLTTYNKNISSPTTAALLQMGEMIKSNPSDRTPFSQRTPVHYSSEKALQTYLTENVKRIPGADLPTKITAANTFVEDAQIASRYGLNTQDITKFAQEVLSDYLFAASCNRGLVRTLIRNLPDLRADRTTISKLLALFPQQPQAFYDGAQRVFVARPPFMYPAYAESLLSRRDMNSIVSFARGYPRNMKRTDQIPAGMRRLVGARKMSPFEDLRVWLTQSLTRAREATDSSPWLEGEYRERGHFEAIIRHLAEDPREDTRRRYFRPLCYYSDLGGFYPSPPPKWPRKLMYAIMDGFLENLPHIINMDDPTNSNLTPVQMAYFSEPIEKTDTIEVSGYQKKSKRGKVKLSMDEAKQIIAFDLKKDTLGSKGGKPEQKDYLAEFVDLKGVAGKIANSDSDIGDIDKITEFAEMLRTIQKDVGKAVEKLGKDKTTLNLTTELTFDPSGPKSVLEMVYDIAEIASTKYDYNMRGDDFKFTMAMVHYSFNALAESTVGSMFDLTNRVDTALSNILGGDKYRRLEELRQSISQREFSGGARAAYIQSTRLAQLYQIRDEMQVRMGIRMSDDMRQATREELRREYQNLVRELDRATLSPSFNRGVQAVLLEMREIIEGA